MSAPCRVACVGFSGSVVLVTLAGCGRGIMQYAGSARRGGTTPRSPASTRAPSRKARASSASRRSKARACAAPIFREGLGARRRPGARLRRRADAAAGLDRGRQPSGAQPRWPISQQQPYPRRSRIRAPPSPARRCRSKRPAASIRSSAIRSSRCSARRRPTCRRRRTGSAATASRLQSSRRVRPRRCAARRT